MKSLLNSLHQSLTSKTSITLTFDQYIDKLIKLHILSDLETTTQKQKDLGILINPLTRQITLFTKTKKPKQNPSNIYTQKYITATTSHSDLSSQIITHLKQNIYTLLGKARAKS